MIKKHFYTEIRAYGMDFDKKALLQAGERENASECEYNIGDLI